MPFHQIILSLAAGVIPLWLFVIVRGPTVTIGPRKPRKDGRKGPNATNTVFKIHLADDLPLDQLLPILAQEYWESRIRALLMPIWFIAKFVPATKRWLEINGHEREVQADFAQNPKLDVTARRLREARALTRYPQFERLGEKNTAAVHALAMAKVSAPARKWAVKNLQKLERLVHAALS